MKRWREAPSRQMSESGAILMEFAVALPIFVLLLTFLAFALIWSWRSYQRTLADAELHQEIQVVFARVVESALSADSIRQRGQGDYELRHGMGAAAERYRVDDGQLVLSHGQFPLTGAFTGAGVRISHFEIKEEAPRLYRIVLTGESLVTGHIHTQMTCIYLREDAHAQ